MVENMLSEADAIEAFTAELRGAFARTGVGDITHIDVMGPEQVAEIGIKLKTGEEISCHVMANPDGTFEFVKAVAPDFEYGNDFIPVRDVADFIAKLP